MHHTQHQMAPAVTLACHHTTPLPPAHTLIHPIWHVHPSPPLPHPPHRCSHIFYFPLLLLLPPPLLGHPQVAQRWRFPATPAGLQRLGPKTAVLPHARLADLGAALHNKGYQVRGLWGEGVCDR